MIEQTVFIVDDDTQMRRSLTTLLDQSGFKTATLDSAEAFLQAHHEQVRGCIVLDVRMSKMSWLELQADLLKRN